MGRIVFVFGDNTPLPMEGGTMEGERRHIRNRNPPTTTDETEETDTMIPGTRTE